MGNKKLLLIALGVFIGSLWRVSAGEFPDDWTWNIKPEWSTANAAITGKPMPPLKVSDWINGRVKPRDLKGKVVVVEFYATWCEPCMHEIPHNNAMLAKYKSQGLVFIGVCTNKRGQEKFATNALIHNITYPAARDTKLKSQAAWAVHFYPHYAVIDRKGILRATDLHPEHVEDVVQKLLAEPAP